MPEQSHNDTEQPAREPGSLKVFLYAQPSVIGKYLFRVREAHVTEHLAPLIRRRTGAAKLDLVLRGLALPPAHVGARKEGPGLVLPRHSYEMLHDLTRFAELGGDDSDLEASAKVTKLKRKWVGDQLEILEEMGLVRRVRRPGRRPILMVLRDDGSGDPFDDPDGRSSSDRYITIHGTLIASRTLARWKGAELSAYLAAMYAERYDDRRRGLGRQMPGTGQWFRPLDWFEDADGKYGPPGRPSLPLSVSSLERGMTLLADEDLIRRRRTTLHPRANTKFSRPRTIYTNRFGSVTVPQLLPAREIAAGLDEDLEAEEL